MSREGARALARDVFIYDLRDFDTLLGGLVLTAGVTNANFYAVVDIIIDISPPGPFFLQDENGETIAQDAQPLLPGRYFVVADGTVKKAAEAAFTRMMSFQTGTRVDEFRDEVRERDGRCVVTKEENLNKEFGLWEGFEAAHIFPLAYEHQWKTQGWTQQITILPSRRSYGTINSVQNGLLLRDDIHTLFDSYHFSINPDDGYKIICFQRDSKRIAGTFLDARLLNNTRRPLETLLRWHFRQAVLTNMKGVGEPHFEHDFPPGSDIMGDIQSGPKAAERMEFELFGRLAHHIDLYPEEKQAGVDTDKEDKHNGNVSDKG
ncbi:HNH endonuclease-domain-containing protein [Cercophora newfieldiana]|uniref:HNH endonuclease-domain-containing protein n=1 Tax=Cercophora newfieldiana TaxID=92897 RepID=A0AA40CUR2_9PEZI|nr:HNH endonuclease-domain-containing protein [Cercophora newfieldiana]